MNKFFWVDGKDGGVFLIRAEDVAYVHRSGNASDIYMKHNNVILHCSTSISEIQRMLNL